MGEVLRAAIDRAVKAAMKQNEILSAAPVYFGHPRRGGGGGSEMYAAIGSEPFGSVKFVARPTSLTAVMSLGTGHVVILGGPDSGKVRP